MIRQKNNDFLLSYFNYKFNNLAGEKIKLDLVNDIIYHKYTKNEVLFKMDMETIKKYDNQKINNSSSTSSDLNKKVDDMTTILTSNSDSDDQAESLKSPLGRFKVNFTYLDALSLNRRETRKFRPY